MFARFNENPAMTLQDIKETKRYGRTDGQRENSIPPTNKVCGGYNYNFPRLQRGSNIFRGGGGGQSIRIQITCDFPGGGFEPPSPSGSWHENSLFRCFAHGLKMCMSCALEIIVKLFSLSLFYELVIQLQVDICILDTILMLPDLFLSLWRWQLLGSLSFVLQ